MKQVKLYENWVQKKGSENWVHENPEFKLYDPVDFAQRWFPLYGEAQKFFDIDPTKISDFDSGSWNDDGEYQVTLSYNGDLVIKPNHNSEIFPSWEMNTPIPDYERDFGYDDEDEDYDQDDGEGRETNVYFKRVNSLDVSDIESKTLSYENFDLQGLNVEKFRCVDNKNIEFISIIEHAQEYVVTGCPNITTIYDFETNGLNVHKMDISNNNISNLSAQLYNCKYLLLFKCNNNNLICTYPDLLKKTLYHDWDTKFDLSDNPWLLPPLGEDNLALDSEGIKQWNIKDSIEILIDRIMSDRCSVENFLSTIIIYERDRSGQLLHALIDQLAIRNIGFAKEFLSEALKVKSDILLSIVKYGKLSDEGAKLIWGYVNPDELPDIVKEYQAVGNWIPPDFLARMKKYDHSEYRDSKLDSEWKEVF